MDAADDGDLELLIKENAALQAENAALRLETKEQAVTFESDEEAIEPTPEEEAAWLQVKVQVEALRREREALQNVLCLAEELQGLQRTNVGLREATKLLTEENALLQAQQVSGATPAVGSRAAASTIWSGGEDPLAELDSKVYSLSVELGRGNQDALLTGNQQQRKDLVAAMLNAGLFRVPGLEATLAPAAVNQEVRIAPVLSGQQPKVVSGTADPYRGGVAQVNRAPTTMHTTNAQLAAADARFAPQPVSMQVSLGHDQEVAEAVRRGDAVSKEQRKELIANMLKTGLFCAPPGVITATVADERAMEITQDRAKLESLTLSQDLPKQTLEMPLNVEPAPKGSTSEKEVSRKMNRYARDIALKAKLQTIHAAHQ